MYVNEIDVHFTESYLGGTFNSCKSVQFPSSGQLALDLMCGEWGSSKCSPQRWFGFMGDKNTPGVPFQINYKAHNSSDPVDGFTPMNPRVVPCNESVDVSDKTMMNVALEADFSFFSFTGNSTRVLVCRLRFVVSKAASARTHSTEVHHLGPRWLRRRDVLHFPPGQHNFCHGDRMLFELRDR